MHLSLRLPDERLVRSAQRGIGGWPEGIDWLAIAVENARVVGVMTIS
jgi:hypothetical protein